MAKGAGVERGKPGKTSAPEPKPRPAQPAGVHKTKDKKTSKPTKHHAVAGATPDRNAQHHAPQHTQPGKGAPAANEPSTATKLSKKLHSRGTGQQRQGHHHHHQQQQQQAKHTGQARIAATVSAAAGSNWAALRVKIGATGEGAKKRKERETAASKKPSARGSNTGVTPIIALDCEMVGVGPGGERSALARVAVVNQEGNVLMDSFVRPKEKVTDFRTKFSGVRPQDILSPDAIELEEAQSRVAALIKNRTLVGHALTNDLKVLMLDHPRKDIRDTSRYPPLMAGRGPGQKPKARALRHLASEELGLDIQSGEHSPVDDARAALYLYLKYKKDWESAIVNGTLRRESQAIKDARKAALTAAAAVKGAAAAMAGGAEGAAGSASLKAVLTAGELRALRQGRNIKKKGSGSKAANQNTAAGVAAGVPRGAGRPAGGQMTFDADEVQNMAARAAAEAARNERAGGSRAKRQKTMQQVMQRDVRLDPLADL